VTRTRTYSRHTLEAILLLGRFIRLERKRRGWTVANLAERVGVTPVTLRKIENGDPTCSAGLMFEAAAILGIPLFASDHEPLASSLKHTAEVLALLPKKIRTTDEDVDDDF